MINKIKAFFFPGRKDDIKTRFPNSQVAEDVCLTDTTVLEGYNCIYDGATIANSSIGRLTYIGAHSNLSNCKVGRFCSISWNVEVVAGRHPLSAASLHPIFYSSRSFSGLKFCDDDYFEQYRYAAPNYYVVIGNDVLIASHALLLDGITIGDGAIILAGAVVTKNVAPYTIVGGVPARPIKTRFSKEIIEKLQQIKWWDRDLEWLKTHADDFQDIHRLIKLFEEDFQ